MSATPARESATVTTDDGVRLNVEALGAPGKVTVVFVHGWCLSGQIWRHQLRELSERPGASARLIAYDHRGHGRSGTVPGPVTLPRLAEDLVTVLDQAVGSVPVVLVGHSLGGLTIMELALRSAWFRQRVRGAIFVNTAPGHLSDSGLSAPRPLARLGHGVVPAKLARGVRSIERSGDAVGPRGVAIQRAYLRWVLFGAHVHPADVALGVDTMLETAAPSCAGLAALTAAERDALATTLAGVPVRVVAGGRDKLVPVAHSRVIAERVSDARLSVLAGAGHMVPLERPSALTAMISEVAGLARPRLQPA